MSKVPSIITQLKSNALTIQNLQLLTGTLNTKQCRWLYYDQLKSYDLKTLMQLGAVVILLQIETKHAPKVGHFILLLDHGSHYEHFDSYGFTMDEELSITHEKPFLTHIFRTSTKRVVDNPVRLQQMREDVNTCGRWVVARLLMRELELEDFLKLIKYFIRPADDLVAAMTLLLAFKK